MSWPGGWKSGFCCIGHCEGTKPKGAISGRPAKTCPFTTDCTCKCHKDIDKMFAMMEMERTPQDNPDYVPMSRTWWMPSDDPDWGVSSSAPTALPPVIIESLVPDVAPPTVARSFAPTDTGRAGRGELEYRVKEATDLWAITQSKAACTPGWIAEQIQLKYDLPKPPSQGAIDSVLKRWVDLGFGTMEKKPTRFTGYTPEGLQHGLDGMKLRARQRRGMDKAAANRGERR